MESQKHNARNEVQIITFGNEYKGIKLSNWLTKTKSNYRRQNKMTQKVRPRDRTLCR